MNNTSWLHEILSSITKYIHIPRLDNCQHSRPRLNKIQAFPAPLPTRRSRLCIRLLTLLSQHALGGAVMLAAQGASTRWFTEKKGMNLELHVILSRAWPQASGSVVRGRKPPKTPNGVLCTKKTNDIINTR